MRRLAALTLLLAVVACGSDEAPADREKTSPQATTSQSPRDSTPQETAVETLIRALDEGDCAAVKDVVVTPSAIDCGSVSEAAGLLAAEGIDPDRVTYESGQIAGDSSTVAITWGNGQPPESFDVQRVDRDWLVVFDSSP